MKLWLTATIVLVLLSGCTTQKQTIKLKNRNAQLAYQVKQQQNQIDALQKKLNTLSKKRTKRRKTRSSMPTKPKKNIKLKKVEDNNYSSGYMYPGEKKKSAPKVAQTSSTMSKSECIGMIGADKFAKYTQMYGGEAASLKRCGMLKAMQN